MTINPTARSWPRPHDCGRGLCGAAAKRAKPAGAAAGSNGPSNAAWCEPVHGAAMGVRGAIHRPEGGANTPIQPQEEHKTNTINHKQKRPPPPEDLGPPPPEDLGLHVWRLHAFRLAFTTTQPSGRSQPRGPECVTMRPLDPQPDTATPKFRGDRSRSGGCGGYERPKWRPSARSKVGCDGPAVQSASSLASPWGRFPPNNRSNERSEQSIDDLNSQTRGDRRGWSKVRWHHMANSTRSCPFHVQARLSFDSPCLRPPRPLVGQPGACRPKIDRVDASIRESTPHTLAKERRPKGMVESTMRVNGRLGGFCGLDQF